MLIDRLDRHDPAKAAIPRISDFAHSARPDQINDSMIS
jgi:hypothetical protein